MNVQEIEEKYQQSTQRFQEGRHAEALALLDELAPALPASLDLISRRAHALTALGRMPEAQAAREAARTRLDEARADGQTMND